MGKLFDENGEPLYACGAKKGDRRYRYFVSRKLVRGADKSGDRGWRVSAEAIDRAVMAAARQMLSDRGALASTLKACGLAAAELKQALKTVDSKVKLVDEIGSMDAAGSIIDRVELKRDGMQITLNLRALLPTDHVLGGGASIRMTRVLRMQMKRRGSKRGW
jgi:site-specific DNA recombinase